MRKNRKRLLLNLAKILVTVVLLAVVLFTVDIRQVWQVVRNASWAHLLLAWALYQVGILIRSLRWRELLLINHVDIRFWKLVELYYVGTFFNSFLPTGFGGDVVKMYELSRAGAQGGLAVSTVLADRVVGLATLFAMALLVLPFAFRIVPTPFILLLLAIIVGFTLILGLLLNRRLVAYLVQRSAFIRRQFERPNLAAFYASLGRYRLRALWKALLASLVFNLSLIAVYILLGIAVIVHISAVYYFILIPIISSVMVLPISVSGLGVREGGYVLLFGQAGVAQPQALAMSLLFYALNVVTGAAGGVLYLVQNARAARERSAEA